MLLISLLVLPDSNTEALIHRLRSLIACLKSRKLRDSYTAYPDPPTHSRKGCIAFLGRIITPLALSGVSDPILEKGTLGTSVMSIPTAFSNRNLLVATYRSFKRFFSTSKIFLKRDVQNKGQYIDVLLQHSL